MSKEKEPPKSAEIIKGPWPNSNIKVPDIDGLQLIEELNFADHLTEGIMVQLIETMKENNIDVGDAIFLSDIGFVIEAVKAVIYRSMGRPHPLQEVMGNLIDMKTIKNGFLYIFCGSVNIVSQQINQIYLLNFEINAKQD